MFDKERIIYQLERTRVLTLVERMPHDKWFEMPTGISTWDGTSVTSPPRSTSSVCLHPRAER